MKSNKFEYSALSIGLYKALLWLTIPIAFTPLLLFYVPFLIFLGIGLRPFLEKTGLYLYLPSLKDAMEEKRYRKLTEQKTEEIDEKYRKLRERNETKIK